MSANTDARPLLWRPVTTCCSGQPTHYSRHLLPYASGELGAVPPLEHDEHLGLRVVSWWPVPLGEDDMQAHIRDDIQADIEQKRQGVLGGVLALANDDQFPDDAAAVHRSACVSPILPGLDQHPFVQASPVH